MKSFLNAVAEGYFSRYDDISRLTFVMPNKRSGTFLLNSFRRLCVKPTLAPRVITITDLVTEISDTIIDSRINSLFQLFDCYREIKGLRDGADFDSFTSWGETVLNDFGEVDMSMVDADSLYKNVKDLNELQSNFFTDEQKKVIEEYFGNSYLRNLDEGSFWAQFEGEIPEFVDGKIEVSEEDNAKRQYLRLWQILNPLYHSFISRQEKSGRVASGHAFRMAAEKLDEDADMVLPGEKLVFVGFNALTESERRIFKALKASQVEINGAPEPKADFIWDPVSEFLVEDGDPASRFVGSNMRGDRFPSPEWMEPYLKKARPDEPPQIRVISVPSNVMQLKVTSDVLESIGREVSEEEIANAKVAVVLPDENLLLPLLYSLPDRYADPNLTMGFPLRHTPVVSFLGLIRKLQARARVSDDQTIFFFEDVKDLLGHPYSQVLFERQNLSEFIKENASSKRITVNRDDMMMLGKNAPLVFQDVTKDKSSKEVILYLFHILQAVKEGMVSNDASFLRTAIETTYIDTYIDALNRLDASMAEYDLNISAMSVFRLSERLIAGESVAFEGEPLQGLQIMGVLETRALDFDYVVMPGLNDKVMPRQGRSSTFIPNSLRREYLMPPANFQEELFAYYFFRLAGRCKKMVLTYDSRASENRGGGISRYILQLRYLAEKIVLQEEEAKFGMAKTENPAKEIAKSDEIQECLGKYEAPLEDAKKFKKISASSLSHYCNCPLQFLFNDVLGLYVEREKPETIDAIDMGLIVHEVMQRLYLPGSGKETEKLPRPRIIDEKLIDNIMNARVSAKESLIEFEVRRAINHYHFGISNEAEMEAHPLRGSARFLKDNIVNYVKGILQFDRSKGPFTILGCELSSTFKHTLSDGRVINVKMVIDRLDRLDGMGGALRVVDYKTGQVHLKADNLENLFDGTFGASNILQLAFYASMLVEYAPELAKQLPEIKPEELADNLELVIYHVPSFQKPEKERKDGERKPWIMGEKVANLAALRKLTDDNGDNFDALLDRKLREIFDSSVPFRGQPTPERCRFCDYKLRCELL